ncbi:MAG: glycoside hydrolase family 15 protein [Beijerinckiaceae bacterium]|nr:MAG: glycoside hydrolase family 15 protein [Beijerinckiaceae bacterium]
MEDYGIISDCSTAALVGRNGAIDWLCWPRFDSASCFCALLGDRSHGRWLIAPTGETLRVSRSYRGETMVLETIFETSTGSIALIDFMPVNASASSIIRIVEGRAGEVSVSMDMTLRFDYGSSVPWVTRLDDGHAIVAIAGPNLAVLRSTVGIRGEDDLSTAADFVLHEGERAIFVMSYGESYRAPPEPVDAEKALETTLAFWSEWAKRCGYRGHRREAVIRSLLTLKALSYTATGGIAAAATTSLPEQLGGERNWDYRFCWVRDATLTLEALMGAGYYDEAKEWCNWLYRAVAGTPQDLHIMYGLAGERRLVEWEVPWLPGYQGAKPVRIGNSASNQLQLDVYGEMMDVFHLARMGGLADSPVGWSLQCGALDRLATIWSEPDDGIWETRGGRRQFTHSKVMAWVAFDRAIQDCEEHKLDAPLEKWLAIRDDIHQMVCDQGYNAKCGYFTQSFGSSELDASLLMIPIVGFLPVDDPRVAATVAAIERDLLKGGFVARYHTEGGADGLPPGEGVFLACSFWLADVYLLQGRDDEANALMDQLLALRNDLGLLSEEYDPRAKRQVGNFPQAFSHLALVRTALGLHRNEPLRNQLEAGGPAG